jgi:polyisoprenoid-binding protein YceI
MKRSILLSVAAFLLISVTSFAQGSGKLVSSKTHIKFFSTTPAENIEANNTASVSTINKESGEVVYSVPMQGFEFEKALMQKHFNSADFLNTQTYPKAKFKGRIANLSTVNFAKDGVYPVEVDGDLTIKEVTKPVKEKGTITVKGNAVEVQSKFNITLADYGISFVAGKPSTNIAKTVEVTVIGEYQPE